jgi:uncharacterized protein (TIGR02217 family)
VDFDNVRFPPRIALGAVGGPRFKTSVSEMANGRESRVQWWATERGEWTVSFSAQRQEGADKILAFFRTIGQGMANTFRFKDWNDYRCAVGDGVFIDTADSPPLKQMAKRYSFQGIDGTLYTYDRVIVKPVEGAITTDASGLDYATGIANSGTTWSGEFDCWARLGSDVMKAQILTPKEGGFVSSFDGIEIIEVSPAEIGDLAS